MSDINRDVIREAFELLDKHSSSDVWHHATDEECADHQLAYALLKGELDGEHIKAAREVSEVLE